MKKGSFNPYLLFLHLKKIPEGSNIYRFPLDESEGRLWLLFRGILRDSGEENASGVTYSATLPGRFKFSPTLAWRTVKCPWVAQSSYRSQQDGKDEVVTFRSKCDLFCCRPYIRVTFPGSEPFQMAVD